MNKESFYKSMRCHYLDLTNSDFIHQSPTEIQSLKIIALIEVESPQHAVRGLATKSRTVVEVYYIAWLQNIAWLQKNFSQYK